VTHLHRTACAASAALLLVALDGAPRPRRAVAAVAAVAPAAAAADSIPAFTLFGWIAPPLAFSTPERYAELAGCGLDVVHRAWDDSFRLAGNRARFDLARPLGLRCLVADLRFDRVDAPGVDSEALLDSIVADYRDEPAFFGYLFADEPQRDEFARLARWHRALRARDAAHPAYNNLIGRGYYGTREQWLDYLGEYLDSTGAAILSADHYDFRESGDTGLFVDHVAGLNATARARGIPFWNVVQLVEHGPYRALTEGELRWQTGMSLAYAARGICYFTYWTPAPDTHWNWQPAVIGWEGARTAWWDVLAALNPRLRVAGETLAGLTWLATEHAGSVPVGGAAFAPDDWVHAVEGRCAIGAFTDAAGDRHLLVVNADSAAARRVTLSLGADRVRRLGGDGRWEELAVERLPGGSRLPLDLAAGDFVLLALGRGGDGVAAGIAPRLRVHPNPAAGAVAFTLERVSASARLEVLDPLGRRIWSSRIAAGAATAVTWRGERDGGGRAAPGVYVARVEDARGVAARRFVWLGAE
jgi:hypothetical protein